MMVLLHEPRTKRESNISIKYGIGNNNNNNDYDSLLTVFSFFFTDFIANFISENMLHNVSAFGDTVAVVNGFHIPRSIFHVLSFYTLFIVWLTENRTFTWNCCN